MLVEHTPKPWKKSSVIEGDGAFIEISDHEGRLIADVKELTTMTSSESKKPVEQAHKRHWFREYAEKSLPQHLPDTVIRAIRAVLEVKGENQLSDIQQIIGIYDELTEIKEGESGPQD